MARKSRKNLPQPEQAAASVLLPELEEAKIPAAIYGRLSVEDEEKEESMETQIALVQDYINRSSELSYVDTYFDNGFTGTNFKRPAFTRLMNDVRQKKIKCIVVKDLSRFGRNYLEAGYYIETVFPFLGIRLIAVTDNFDSTRKEDMESLALPIRNMVNAMYAKDISKKIWTSLQRSSQAIVLSGIIFPNQLVIFGIHHTSHIVRIKLFPFIGHLANFIGQAHNFALCTVDGILHILDFLQFFQHLPFIAQLDNEQMQLIHYQGFQQFFWNLVADALIVGLPCLADVIADLFTFLRSMRQSFKLHLSAAVCAKHHSCKVILIFCPNLLRLCSYRLEYYSILVQDFLHLFKIIPCDDSWMCVLCHIPLLFGKVAPVLSCE